MAQAVMQTGSIGHSSVLPLFSAQNSSEFPGMTLRCVLKDGEPWFVAADVCRATGHTSPTMAVKSLDADEVAKLNLGPGPLANSVSESGLYSLVMPSHKPELPRSSASGSRPRCSQRSARRACTWTPAMWLRLPCRRRDRPSS